MNYAIYYNSITGNTALLANQIKSTIKGNCLYMGNQFDSKMLEADIVFIGFWTDKGRCSDPVIELLKELKDKKIYLFGTAGFGGAAEYFEKIIENVKKQVDSTCVVLGTYMCQGKMPMSVGERYQKMVDSDPQNEQFKGMIANFNKALSHPDEHDLTQFKDDLKKLFG